MIKCLCCGKKIKKNMYNHIYCKKCAEHHKKKDGGLRNKNSKLQRENDDLKKRIGIYE